MDIFYSSSRIINKSYKEMQPQKRFISWRMRSRVPVCLVSKEKSQVKQASPRLSTQSIVRRPDGRVPPIVHKTPIQKPRIITVPPAPKVYPRVARRVPTNVTPTPITRHHVYQPKEGELVLNEPPSVYFRRIGKIINPPIYLN